MIDRMEWRSEGACVGQDPRRWFPESGGGGPARRQTLQICRTECPVRAECLNHALDHNEVYGIWGGTTETQRRTMLSKRRRGAKMFFDGVDIAVRMR